MSFTLQFSSVTHSGVLNIIMYIFLRNTLKDWALTPVPADLETGFFPPPWPNHLPIPVKHANHKSTRFVVEGGPVAIHQGLLQFLCSYLPWVVLINRLSKQKGKVCTKTKKSYSTDHQNRQSVHQDTEVLVNQSPKQKAKCVPRQRSLSQLITKTKGKKCVPRQRSLRQPTIKTKGKS